MSYTYIYHDERMIPYYVGKGSGKRAFVDHGAIPVPPRSRILIQFWESEAKAFEMEVWWIALYGRKDIGTGCLLNQDDGGRAPSKRTCSRGGKIQGRKNVESGQIASISSLGGKAGIQKMTREQRARGGRKSIVQMRTFFNPALMPGFAKDMGTKQGRLNVESGHLKSISSAGGKVGGEISAHLRWHVNRGIHKLECRLCRSL